MPVLHFLRVQSKATWNRDKWARRVLATTRCLTEDLNKPLFVLFRKTQVLNPCFFLSCLYVLNHQCRVLHCVVCEGVALLVEVLLLGEYSDRKPWIRTLPGDLLLPRWSEARCNAIWGPALYFSWQTSSSSFSSRHYLEFLQRGCCRQAEQ